MEMFVLIVHCAFKNMQNNTAKSKVKQEEAFQNLMDIWTNRSTNNFR